MPTKTEPGLNPARLEFQPLTQKNWDDLENLFGERGACGGCWCMYWRLKRSEFEKTKGEGNRRAMKAIVDSGEVPGLIAYDGDLPIGWVSVAPRDSFPVLGRSRILKPVDEKPVWSVVCFFVAKGMREQSVSVRLLEAAFDYAAGQGAEIVEGYPIEPKKGVIPDPFAWVGLASTFLRAGFHEVLRRSDTRPVMRREII